MSESALRAIQEDAKRQNVSVNTLVNQVILSYANFDRFVRKLHMIKLSRPTFRRVLDAAPEDAIIEAGREAGKDIPKFFILAKEGVISLETVLAHLRDMSDYGNLFQYAETVQGGRRVVTLAHELGLKGTLFIAHYVQTVFENVDIRPTFTLGDNSVIIEL
jgi:hypothetical protein